MLRAPRENQLLKASQRLGFSAWKPGDSWGNAHPASAFWRGFRGVGGLEEQAGQ